MRILFLSLLILSLNAYSAENGKTSEESQWHIHSCQAQDYHFKFNQITGEFTHNFAGSQSETTVLLYSLGFDPQGVVIENEDGTVGWPIYFHRWEKYEAPDHHGNVYDILNIQLALVGDKSFVELFFYQPGVALIAETFDCE